MSASTPTITRKLITLGTNPSPVSRPISPPAPSILVINASLPLARELTYELSKALPGHSILFAPTLRLALWLVQRRKIKLVISSSELPDGSLSELDRHLSNLNEAPELLIVSNIEHSRYEISKHEGYRFIELRRLNSELANLGNITGGISDEISNLGADLRNDLNNPLQEIVAMAFVAHTSSGLSHTAEGALKAIERAALGMSQVVNGLEEKIRVRLGG